MAYRIIATHDTIGKDREYLTDATTENISDEVVETLNDCVKRLHEIANEGKANNIEVIYPNTSYSNWHTSFYSEDHPFAEVEYIFDQIDLWAEHRKNTPRSTLPSFDSTIRHNMEHDSEDLPF